MSVTFRVVLIAASVLTLWYTARKIRKSQMQIEDAIFWIGFPAVLVVLSVVPGIAGWAAGVLGIQSAVNFIYLSIIFVLILKIFSLSIRFSQMDAKIRTLTQEIAIRERLEKDEKIKDETKVG